MDLLIEKNGQVRRLSDLGLYNIVVDDSSPAVDISTRTVKGRNGRIFDGLTYTEKTIEVKARLTVPTMEAFFDKKDELNRYVLGDDGFYITKMYPERDDLYEFELAGQTTGELDLGTIPHREWKYRYKVVNNGSVEYEFIGKSSAGLKYNVSFGFVTSELPYGETSPKNITFLANTFDYAGTATLSQLEVPFIVELTVGAQQTNFYLEIDGRRFTYNHAQTPLQEGNKLWLKGIETQLFTDSNSNGINVNNRTNFEYFVIKPKANKEIPWFSNFKGTIKILGFKELYK
jgi:phage-related protein|nr:MAG TPA: distal tail protein [Caudoviricetes sp.]